MCPGTATKLLCSHYLVHWAGPRCPRKCVLPTKRTFLPCTCAPCDPAFNQKRLMAAHAAEREAFRAAMGDALAAADEKMGKGSEDVQRQRQRRLERQLHGLLVDQMQRLGRAARAVRGLDPAVGCRWPGMYEQWVAENLGRPVDWDALLNK
ncbi:unnamed protein product [Discula destructiva]